MASDNNINDTYIYWACNCVLGAQRALSWVAFPEISDLGIVFSI